VQKRHWILAYVARNFYYTHFYDKFTFFKAKIRVLLPDALIFHLQIALFLIKTLSTFFESDDTKSSFFEKNEVFSFQNINKFLILSRVSSETRLFLLLNFSHELRPRKRL